MDVMAMTGVALSIIEIYTVMQVDMPIFIV